MKRIAIFNSFPHHYELYGSIIEWCKNEGHYLMVLTETKKCMGWLDFYKEFFDFDNFRYWKDYQRYLHLFDLIILTTDDDPEYNPVIYDNMSRTVIINHTCFYRRYEKIRSINFRPYDYRNDNRFCSNVFKYPIKPKLRNEGDPIRIFISATDDRLDLKILKELSQHCELHFVARYCCSRYKNLKNSFFHISMNTKEMIELMMKCNYFYYINELKSLKNYYISSGFVGLAFTCGTPILTTPQTNIYYGFESACYYTNPQELELDLEQKYLKTIVERDRLISNFKRQFDTFLENDDEEYELQIPKKLHFVWLSKDHSNKDIPHKYLLNIKTFKEKNPDFEILYWRDKELQELMETHFPEYIETFKKVPYIISKCDFARALIVYVHGGVYSDLDYYCRDSLKNILRDKTEVYFEEAPEHGADNIVNGFFASVPKTSFLRGWIETMVSKFKTVDPRDPQFIIKTTYPTALWNYYMNSPEAPRLSDFCEVNPFIKNGTLSKACKTAPRKQLTYTLWSEGTGWGKRPGDLGARNIENLSLDQLMKETIQIDASQESTLTFFSLSIAIVLGVLFLLLIAIFMTL